LSIKTINRHLNTVTYQYAGPGSTTPYVQVNYETYNIKTQFGCAAVGEYSASSVPLVRSVNLPDGTSYTFQYETSSGSSVTGRISQIGLPTGGKITYQYTGGSGGIDCADGTTAGLTRTTPDGQWTYTRSNTTSVTSTATGITTTILDPALNQTVYTFSDGYETERQTFNGTTTVLSTTKTCYNGNFANCVSASITGQILRKDAYTTPSGGQTRLSETF